MHFMNLGHIYENTARLVTHARTNTRPPPNCPSLTGGRSTPCPYLPAHFNDDKNNNHAVVTYEDGDWADHCLNQGIFAHIFEGATPSDQTTREHWKTSIKSALIHLQEMSPGLHRMVRLLVTDIVVLNSGADGGGSASQMPGVVVMSPASDWKEYRSTPRSA